MTTYSLEALQQELHELLRDYNLSFEDFIELGKTEGLEEIEPLLDFAYRALLPALISPAT